MVCHAEVRWFCDVAEVRDRTQIGESSDVGDKKPHPSGCLIHRCESARVPMPAKAMHMCPLKYYSVEVECCLLFLHLCVPSDIFSWIQVPARLPFEFYYLIGRGAKISSQKIQILIYRGKCCHFFEAPVLTCAWRCVSAIVVGHHLQEKISNLSF